VCASSDMRVILFLILLFTPLLSFAGDTFENWYSGSINILDTNFGVAITSGNVTDSYLETSILGYSSNQIYSGFFNNFPFASNTPTTLYVDYSLYPNVNNCTLFLSVNDFNSDISATVTSNTNIVNATMSGTYSGVPIVNLYLMLETVSSACSAQVTRVYDDLGFDYLNFKPTSIIINSDGILSDMLLNTTCVSESATTSCAYEYSDVTTVDHFDSYFYFMMFFVVFWSFVFLATLFKKYKYGNY